jgi:endonuclease/exonuclease/phosphatase family metal-dependent hydrolase
MEAPTHDARAGWGARVGDQDLHRRLLEELPCLHQVGRGGHTGPHSQPTGWLRVVAWNVQRGHRPAALAARLRESGAGVCLLSELDDGMARTGNEDMADVIATDIGAGYAFGVEFVELGLGDDAEQRAAAGQANERGWHGNAIMSPADLGDPVVVRLPESGPGWFAADSSQPRVGGRMAVLATVTLDGVPVELASAHLENRTDAGHRAEQMEVILQALDERSEGGAAVVGGDFNTLGVSFAELLDSALVRRLRRDEPTRFTWPVADEPLFEVARAHGFEWTNANVAAPTTEHDAGGLPDHVPLKLDWILVRGLVARRPAVIPANGLSDHHAVSVGVRVPLP